jgi:SAM-dependent methyltransferase
VSEAVSTERWTVAQGAEQTYWDGLRRDDREFGRVLLEKSSTVNWVAERLPGGLPKGDAVEIGIGPLGVGCIHFLPNGRERTLVGVEPLPLIDSDALHLVEPFAALVRACRVADYTHVRAAGEETGLDSERFAIAFCYNVLDHVRDPLAVLRETHRILEPGGTLVLGVDTQSTLSVLRFRLLIERRHAGSIGVRAHPFRFRAHDARRLVESAGFSVGNSNERRPRALYDLVGHAHRLFLLCDKR